MDTTDKTHRHGFVPAMGYDLLTPLYDTMVALTLNERAVKQQLIDQARLAPGMTVVDLGCGTGTLAVMLKQSAPQARVIGVDVDSKILGIARTKIEKAGVEVELRQGLVQEVGLAPASIDRSGSGITL